MTRSPSAPDSLLSFARASEPALRLLLEEKVRQAVALPIDLTPSFERLAEYVLRGGKRLRGALCLLGCAAGGGAEKDAFPAALGLELFHAYLLVHDDFMDRDAERRGGPTIHVALAEPGLARSRSIRPAASRSSMARFFKRGRWNRSSARPSRRSGCSRRDSSSRARSPK